MARTGRPSGYGPHMAETARKVAALGATDAEIADILAIDIATLYRWKASHQDFCEALRIGKEPIDERVERSLYQRAVGYTYDAVKIAVHAETGNTTVTPYREHVPPDTTACIFWLKNRRRDEWRDVSRQEMTGKDGGPMQTVVDGDPEKIARVLALITARAEKASGG